MDKGVEPVPTFCGQGKRGKFFAILCGRLLWTAPYLLCLIKSNKLLTQILKVFAFTTLKSNETHASMAYDHPRQEISTGSDRLTKMKFSNSFYS